MFVQKYVKLKNLIKYSLIFPNIVPQSKIKK